MNTSAIKKVLFLLIFFTLFQTNNAQISPPAGIGNNIILWLSPDTALYKTTNNVAGINDWVREWHDISGSGFVFTTPSNNQRPRLRTYLNKRVLDFVNGDLLENTGVASIINGLTEFSIYIVVKSDNLNTDQGFLNSKDPNGADEILGMRYDVSGANTGRTNLIKCGMQGNSPNNQIESQSNTQTNQLQVLTLTWKQGEKINLYIDGTLNESSINNISTSMNGVQKILLGKGGKDTGNNTGWDGRIGTVIFYNKKMSPDTVSLISGDLRSINSIQTGDWTNPSTWDCNCVPPNNGFVKINNTHTVTLNSTTTINNLIIDNGGILDLSTSNHILNIKRHLTVNGSIIPNQGEIRMNGSEPQLIDGSNKKNFYDLIIDNTNGVKLVNGASDIYGTLDIRNGCFETNNVLTLISNATRTARIDELNGSACITGNINMQRYIDAGATDWRFITSSVSGATLAQLKDDFITSGFVGSHFPNWPTASNPWPSIYTYDETQLGIQDNGFNPATNITNPMPVGSGFWVWSGDTSTGTQPFTIDFYGPANTGNINLPMSYTNSGLLLDDGWNMVGNPYPSSIDWNSNNITKSNINNAIYIWNPDLQQFGSYIANIGINGGSRYIASSQAFWVQANALGATIQLTEGCKTPTDGAFLKQSVSQLPLIISAQNNYGKDEMAINFDNNATNNFDNLYDALKMTSVNTDLPAISSSFNGNDFSINQLPEQEISIPIKILTGKSGLHTISVENVDSFNTNSCLIIEDLLTNVKYNLASVKNFTVYISNTTTAARFLLHIGAPVQINASNESCYNTNDAKIVYSKNSTTPFDIVWKNSSNTVIANNTNILNSDSITNLPANTYYIETTDVLCGNMIDTVNITANTQITSNYSVATDTINVNTALTPNNLSINAVNYLWDFGDGNTSTIANPNHLYAQTGSYLVNLRAEQNTNCYEDFSKLITVTNTVTGINEVVNSNIKTYINNKILTIELNQQLYSTIEVRNVLGQLIYQNNINKNILYINLSDFSSAIYVVNLIDKNNISKTIKVSNSN